MPLRALVILLTACAVGFVVHRFPQAASPALVVMGALAALDRLVSR